MTSYLNTAYTVCTHMVIKGKQINAMKLKPTFFITALFLCIISYSFVVIAMDGIDNEYALFEQAKSGNEQATKKFCELYPYDSDKKTEFCRNLFIYTDCPQLVKILLDAGAQATTKDVRGATAISRAAQFNRPKSLQILLNHPKTPTLTLDIIQQALEALPRNIDCVFMENMLRKKKSFIQNYTKLVHIATSGTTKNLALTDMLSQSEINHLLNYQDHQGKTLAMLAALYKQADVLKQFVSNGADLALNDANGESTLMYAVRSGYLPTVKLLTESHNHNISMLQIAYTLARTLHNQYKVQHGKKISPYKGIKDFLKLKSSSSNQKKSPQKVIDNNNRIKRPLCSNLCNNGNIEWHASDENIAGNAHSLAVHTLKSLNGNENNEDNHRVCLLYKAISSGHVLKVLSLLETGMNPDTIVKPKEKVTALIHAISAPFGQNPQTSKRAQIPIIEALLTYNASIELTDGYGCNALVIARLYKFEEAIEFLEKAKTVNNKTRTDRAYTTPNNSYFSPNKITEEDDDNYNNIKKVQQACYFLNQASTDQINWTNNPLA